ncbi:MAG: hypothetical protein ABSF64_37580 [Bryobacteraceae bacterium]
MRSANRKLGVGGLSGGYSGLPRFRWKRPRRVREPNRAAGLGYYVDASNVNHGFVRDAKGVVTAIDAPGAGAGAGQGTSAQSVNSAGTVAGYYQDTSGVCHGFVRATSGTITTFDPPGAGTGANQGTFAKSVNGPGAITGFYTDASNLERGFVRRCQWHDSHLQCPWCRC